MLLEFDSDNRRLVITLARYFVGGAVATIVHIAVLLFLVEMLGANPSIATSIGFCIAVTVNYSFQYHWTFASVGPHSLIFSRYLVVTFAMLGLNLLIFWTLTKLYQVSYIYAQLMATGTVMLCNFVINKHFTFGRK